MKSDTKIARLTFIQDLRDLDFQNVDEDKVLNARYLSAYKKKLVVKTPRFVKRSASFGMLFISNNERAGTDHGVNTVRHEYGHTRQLKRLGLPAYLAAIAMPSVRSNPDNPNYYSHPWEVTADTEGGATRYHPPGAILNGALYFRKYRRK